ncbi:hypothetical protein [Plasmodium yoelii yoelii]|uniref:Uncharacterized protein n=1 Tax=Plasmodium yoelii yoelii TaxID=73239 RepID=Q7RP95_PLAYO|nr:hypothetical protein [Plasmodium yoelii yoelii]
MTSNIWKVNSFLNMANLTIYIWSSKYEKIIFRYFFDYEDIIIFKKCRIINKK